MRAALLVLSISLVPAGASAHPVLEVTNAGDGTRDVACGGGVTSEGFCETDMDCAVEPIERTCRETQGAPSYCLGPSDVVCCYADRVATECPLVDGYDVRCVPVPSSDTVRTGEGTAFCIYDRAGTTTCADAAAVSADHALACHTTRESGLDSPVTAENGDCDRDGIPNVEDEAPCGPAVEPDAGTTTRDAGMRGDAGVRRDAGVARDDHDYRGSGGCTCEVRSAGDVPWPWALVAIWVCVRRRGAARGASEGRRTITG